ncbi:hypothetical protein K469DRAFT_678410 [Zopfia rhizophila CBS 207.26]|uniref:Clr5 domain-containing protein n=1 Tax=Zopfia rhizophila CBS 207.26 TaxID=1314779 RepID=A0A6A6DGA5_9PEZI|nr:hypothetical protein K469DRAFT_678410 [Zopfia rhizophila CBS 207.26]
MDPGPASRPSLAERWESLKPDLERLYLAEKLSLAKVMDTMKQAPYFFDANESQYKYRFNKVWGWKRNISASKKQKINEYCQSRAQLGKPTTVFYKGKPVDDRQLRRQAKKATRMKMTLAAPEIPAFPINIFGDVSMHSPSEHASPPSAFSKELRNTTSIQRAHLLLDGNYDKLLKNLDMSEKETLSKWLYQYWYFSFKTAKHWGRGPRAWTARNLDFGRNILSLDGPSPNTNANSPAGIFHSSVNSLENWNDHRTHVSNIPNPSQLCRWSIHVFQSNYEAVSSPLPQSPGSSAEENPEHFKEWPAGWQKPPFEQRLRDNFATNDFSDFKAEDLSISIGTVAKAVEHSPGVLFEEALGFAIMGRNPILVEELLQQWTEEESDISSLYPLHLAITYLDGSRACCQIFALLGSFSDRKALDKGMLINGLGHTLLDNLFIAILRNHSSTPPGAVDDAFNQDRKFAGDEIDICGRWDADSDCYRTLVSLGKSTVPFEWRHKFCHTSIQAVCHCIRSINLYFPLDLFKESGLYIKRCFSCGEKLQLTPFHALVITAFFLGQYRTRDEDLFGMVCCLLSLMAVERYRGREHLNLSSAVAVSIPMLLDTSDGVACSHEEMSPEQLGTKLSAFQVGWSPEAERGWEVIINILQEGKDARKFNLREGVAPFLSDRIKNQESFDPTNLEPEDFQELYYEKPDLVPGYSGICGVHFFFDEYRVFGLNNILGHLWAAVQTELLTYRRQDQDKSWYSAYLDLDTVSRSLKHHVIYRK